MQIKKLLQIIKPKTKSLLGIDITTNSIRLVELSLLGPNNYQVEACINVALDTPASNDLIAKELKKIFSHTRFKTKNVAVALSHSAIIFKEIKIASELTNKEIEDFLLLNIEKYIGEPINNLSFDYQIIKPTIKTDEHTVLKLITVRRERVEKYIELLKAINLYPKIVDIDSYALERVIRKQFKNIAGLIAIINIDGRAILIVVINGEKVEYAHEDFINTDQLESPVQIIMQLKSKMQLVFATLHQPLEKIILAGEKAVLPELREIISTLFNVQTITIDPFLGMQLSPTISQESLQTIAPTMLISCGLALRVADDN